MIKKSESIVSHYWKKKRKYYNNLDLKIFDAKQISRNHYKVISS